MMLTKYRTDEPREMKDSGCIRWECCFRSRWDDIIQKDECLQQNW